LFDITAKLYSKHILHKLEDRVIDNRLLGKEQAGFHLGYSSIDHCFAVFHLNNNIIYGYESVGFGNETSHRFLQEIHSFFNRPSICLLQYFYYIKGVSVAFCLCTLSLNDTMTPSFSSQNG
ncbi:hypothetical protein L345_00465, partial [Ophiophagus hannah]